MHTDLNLTANDYSIKSDPKHAAILHIIINAKEDSCAISAIEKILNILEY
jgi:hypothetical protein